MSGNPASADVITKSEFAALIGVTPGRVSQYISGKKLTGDALCGEGRAARIKVSAALAQLKLRLDIDQRLSANGINTTLDLASRAATPEIDLPLSAADRIEDQIKTERLDSLRRQNRKLAEEEAARAGRYTLAEIAEQEMGRALAQQMTWFEGVLSELASAVCSQFSLSSRDVVHCVRTAFREVRERGSASFQTKAETMPALVDDDALDDSDDALLAD